MRFIVPCLRVLPMRQQPRCAVNQTLVFGCAYLLFHIPFPENAVVGFRGLGRVAIDLLRTASKQRPDDAVGFSAMLVHAHPTASCRSNLPDAPPPSAALVWKCRPAESVLQAQPPGAGHLCWAHMPTGASCDQASVCGDDQISWPLATCRRDVAILRSERLRPVRSGATVRT